MKGNVLWVDDDATGLLEELASIVRETGFSVHTRETFDEAVAFMDERAPLKDWSILIDMILPEASGKTTLREHMGIELAGMAIKRGCRAVVLLSVVPLARVAVSFEALSESARTEGVPLSYMSKTALLHEGEIDRLCERLAAAASDGGGNDDNS